MFDPIRLKAENSLERSVGRGSDGVVRTTGRVTLVIFAGLWLLAASLWAQEKAAMFRGDASHAGTFAGPAPKQLTLRWKFATGGPIVSSPSVVDGTVYVGSADRNLYAVDAKTGLMRWKFDAQGDVNSSPAVVDGVVYVVSLNGNLYAVDAATGKQRWAFATEGERRFSERGLFTALPAGEMMPDPWDFYLSSPTVVDGVVYFGSGDGSVYAVDARSGRLRWRYRTGDVVHASPAVVDGKVYVGSWDTYFYALDSKSGSLVWRFKTGEDKHAHLMMGIQGSAAVSGGTVYFGCRDANVYALDAETGALRWKFATDGSWVIASPAVAEGRVYFTTSDTKRFEALDAASGRLLYELTDKIYSFSSPAIAGGHAYFGTFDGKVHDVDLEKRQYEGAFATEGYYANAPRYLDAEGLLKQDRVWVGDTLDDAIVGIRGKLFSMGSILSSPAVQDGVAYVGSVDGSLYALGS
jgi:outer membrane protein assembly factor BamB